MRKDIIIGELDAERVGLYVRISEQDRKKLTKSQLSKSIENQIAMLKDEAKERDWKIIDIYCDEDISGADQTRTEFNRMLKDCENWLSYAYVPYKYTMDDFMAFNNYCAICSKEIPANEGHYCYNTSNSCTNLKICESCYNSYYG